MSAIGLQRLELNGGTDHAEGVQERDGGGEAAPDGFVYGYNRELAKPYRIHPLTNVREFGDVQAPPADANPTDHVYAIFPDGDTKSIPELTAERYAIQKGIPEGQTTARGKPSAVKPIKKKLKPTNAIKRDIANDGTALTIATRKDGPRGQAMAKLDQRDSPSNRQLGFI